MIPITDRLPRHSPVAVLGLGPMGRALGSAFRAAGHPTAVWNRTPGRAGELLAAGAHEVPLDEAISGARVVVACLMNYAAVTSTLEQVSADWGDRILVNLSSGEPLEARRLDSWAAARGIAYLDGAILSPTPVIGTPAASVLYSGPSAVYEASGDVLRAVGGSAVHVGEDPGRANAYDVALLDLFGTAVHGVAHAFALAAAEGIPAPALAPFAADIGTLLPEMIPRFAERVAAGEHPGDRSTIASAASSIAHVIAAAERHGIDTGALVAARAVIDRSVAGGHGQDGLSYLTTALGGAVS